jgi:hypothetical protein
MANFQAAYRLGVMGLIAVLAFPVIAEEAEQPTFDIDLGAISRFATETDALAACKPDGVVWADRKTGFYYPKFFNDYGKTEYGAYTCYKQALDADYWSLTPASSGGHKGREFPLVFICNTCS